MTRLNTGSRLVKAPLQTEKTATGKTHEGAPGFAREAKSELFMRATTVFAGEGSFYEDAETADARSVELIRKLALEDWAWVKGFLPWLRAEGNIRTAPIMLAAEAVHARYKAGLKGDGTYQLIDSVMLRADEPGEMLQYILKTFGALPRGGSVKKGIALGATRLYNQTSALRWDKPDRPVRFADVIEMCRPRPESLGQARLFKYLLDERHHNDGSHEGLAVISARHRLGRIEPAERHIMAGHALDNADGPDAAVIRLAAARQWEWTNSWLGEGTQSATGLSEAADRAFHPLSKRQRWELIIPELGYMALIRNLRNFEEAGIGKSMVQKIRQRIEDPEEVAESRQLPFRFLSAHLNTKSALWLPSLEEALQASIQNVPVLNGHTLILIDTSGSMEAPLSSPPRKKGSKPDTSIRPDRVKAAALFALALALRNPGKVDVYGFANGNFYVDNIAHGASLLRTTALFASAVGRVGHGTEIEQNVRRTFDTRKHTRVAIFTDMQAFPHGRYGFGHVTGDVMAAVPKGTPVYAWNLAGYSNSAMATGANRVELAGLTDASFGIMQRHEQSKDADWPWLATKWTNELATEIARDEED